MLSNIFAFNIHKWGAHHAKHKITYSVVMFIPVDLVLTDRIDYVVFHFVNLFCFYSVGFGSFVIFGMSSFHRIKRLHVILAVYRWTINVVLNIRRNNSNRLRKSQIIRPNLIHNISYWINAFDSRDLYAFNIFGHVDLMRKNEFFCWREELILLRQNLYFFIMI